MSIKNYWKWEDPEILVDEKLQVRFYEEAGALQFAMKDKNKEGNIYIKKGVKLRKHKLQKDPELVKKLAEIFTDWFDEIEEENDSK